MCWKVVTQKCDRPIIKWFDKRCWNVNDDSATTRDLDTNPSQDGLMTKYVVENGVYRTPLCVIRSEHFHDKRFTHKKHSPQSQSLMDWLIESSRLYFLVPVGENGNSQSWINGTDGSGSKTHLHHFYPITVPTFPEPGEIGYIIRGLG